MAAILRRGSSSEILTTKQSDHDWEAAFPDEAWDYVRYEALARTLDQPVNGRLIDDMKEPGEVWAFWFEHRSRRLYAKINLTAQGPILLLIYSSHIPRKGETRL